MKIAISGITGIFLIFAYIIYLAIFPGNSFYNSEFRSITGIDMPRSGKILRKNSSYPDIHGDYCSSALIMFSENDYKMLLEFVKNDAKFTDSEMVGSAQFDYALGNHSTGELECYASYYERGDHYRFNGFFKDRRTVIIHLASS